MLSRVYEIHFISKSHDFEQLYVTKDTTTDRLVTKFSLVTARSLVRVSQTKLRQSISQLGHPQQLFSPKSPDFEQLHVYQEYHHCFHSQLETIRGPCWQYFVWLRPAPKSGFPTQNNAKQSLLVISLATIV